MATGDIGIGVGINPEAIIQLMKELCIKPDRIEELQEILMAASQNHTGNPIDDLQRFIAQTNKANEVAFLSFMCGLAVGSNAVISNMDVPQIIKKSMMVGAEHADEIKELMKQEGETAPAAAAAAAAATTTTPPKKKDGKPEDIMYG